MTRQSLSCKKGMYACAWQIEEMDADYDPDFLRHMYPRLEWPALREAAQVMGKPLLLTSNQQLTLCH